jgi:hypothetical protein
MHTHWILRRHLTIEPRTQILKAARDATGAIERHLAIRTAENIRYGDHSPINVVQFLTQSEMLA